MADQHIHTSTRALLNGLIDYAGLFPPSGLDMPGAVRNYLTYRDGPFHWMLGRFVVPASRLAEFHSASSGHRLPVTVTIGEHPDQDLAAIGRLKVDTVEAKASTVTQIRSLAGKLSSGPTIYFEVPIAGDPRGLIAEIAEAGARAKARTGGISADAFPGSRDLGRFLQCCAEEQVPFKVTAGLHHPFRGTHSLNGKPEGPTALMHGFLNVFLAAALLRAGEETGKVVQLLEDQSAASFHFDAKTIRWRDEQVDLEQIEDTRRNLAISFGSCSFEEPVTDLKELGVL